MKKRIRERMTVCGLLVVSAAAVMAETPAAGGAALAIRAKDVFDGQAWTGPGVVLLRDGKVSALGADAAVPEGVDLLEAPDLYVTPGLIDAMCVVDSEARQTAFDAPWAARPACPPGASACAGHRGYTSALAASATALCDTCGEARQDELRRQAAERAASDERAPRFPYVSADDAALFTGERHAADSLMGRLEKTAELYEQPDATRPQHSDATCVCCGDVMGSRAALMPAASAVAINASWAEESSEVMPHVRVLDGVNLYSNDFRRLLRGGVTTVYLTPDSASVIGGRGAIVKTGGPLKQRIVRAEDTVKAALGADPSYRGAGNNLPNYLADNFTRRPGTRMGVDFVFRKAFADADAAGRGLTPSGADTPPAEAFPLLRAIVAGEVGLRIQARKQHDILSAIGYARELGFRFLLEEATEAYLCVPQIQAAELSVVYGPMFFSPSGWRDAVGESDDARLITPRVLHDAGVRFSLTAQEGRDEEGLARQAMMATRYGLPAEAALRAVTSIPAAQLGLDGAGTLAAGDLVIWSGAPLSPLARPLAVVIGGEVVYRDRAYAKRD